MLSQLLMLCVFLTVFYVDQSSAGSSYSISSSSRSTIISQHASARTAAWYGRTKLPAAKSSVRSGYQSSLTWDWSLARSAQTWANTCTFGHSSSGNGENIYWRSSTPTQSAATAATPSWLSELSYYSWSTTGSGLRCTTGKMCGHYTQAIWGNTKKIGCALSNCASTPVLGRYKTMMVCQYYPPGNYIGQYPYTRADTVPFGEINPEDQPEEQPQPFEAVKPSEPILGLNIIVFALIAMMAINVTCLIATASKRCRTSSSSLTYQSVHTKEIEV